MMKKVVAVSSAILLLVSSFTGCSAQSSANGSDGSDTDLATDKVQKTTENIENKENLIKGMDFQYSDRDLEGSWDTLDATTVVFKDTIITVNGSGAKASEGILTISDEGTYILSGTLSEGQIIVEAEDTDKIQIVLNGVDISCTDRAPVYIKQADKVFLTLADKTTNIIMDGSSYVLSDKDKEEGVDAAIYSKSDITINGSGALKLTANYKHGIVSKDDLSITGGTFIITAVGDGLRGKDCVKVSAGDFTITVGSDGIQSNNAEDATKGFVSIDGGTFEITSTNDGIQAQTVLRITQGSMHLTTGGGSANAATDVKGLKSGSLTLINDGIITIDSSDDGIYSNKNVEINNGEISLTSGDDGIHADTALLINNGTIEIARSYEGLEGNSIMITDGTIHVTATDDGINAAGEDNFDTSTSSYLKITGGYLVVNAYGDGLDSNGDFYVEGGTVFVSGPTNNGNGTLDYNGTASITGGTVLAAGSLGMAQTFGDTSSQYSLMYAFEEVQEENTSINLKDSSDKDIVSFAPDKEYQTVVISAPSLKEGEEYVLYINGIEIEEITLSSVSTIISNGQKPGSMKGEMP
jgi:hypothetical protein